MEFFNQTYVALRGPAGAPQTPADTIARLSDRLSPATLLADRRASVLALKGLSRDCKQEVGDRALAGLLEVLYNDVEVDADIGKAVLETLNTLCDTEDVAPEGRDLGFKHTDVVLKSDKTTHALFSLLGDTNFYTRFATLQYLTTLLHNRRQAIQSYFLTAPAGPGSIIAVLEDKREIIRNEAITMVQALISQSPDIQKVLAFEGAFEKLFNTVTQEGGVDGGLVAQGALTCVDGLLRFNSSNQSYFRETSLPPVLCALLQFPTTIEVHNTAPQEFALQFWDDQKATNTSIILGVMGMLIVSKGNAVENSPFTRCLVEIALASNAPTTLKVQALRLLPTNVNFPLSQISLTPYVPVPETNGEEWDRLESASALDALVELAIHGEYNGLDAAKRTTDSLELRTAAAGVFENFVRKDEIRQAILQAMLSTETSDPPSPRTTPLLHALASPPNTTSSLDPAAVISTHLATMLFAHLLRSSPRAKATARLVMPGPIHPTPAEGSNNFFVPADGAPSQPTPIEEQEDDDEPQTLLQTLSEHLSLALLSRSRANASDKESREWDRYVVGYLCLLAQWLWEDPKSVRDFLDAGGLGVLVEPINQTSEMDSLVPGLCAFLLGVCYEYNREPGEITRSTISPIVHRLGVDTLIGQMARFREDERFKAIGPDSIVLPYPTPSLPLSAKAGGIEEAEIWFDWAFVDFWKSNYYTVQRGFSTEPDQLSSSSGQSAESAMLIASLRDVIRQQSEEVETLQRHLKEVKTTSSSSGTQLVDLQTQIVSLKSQLDASEEKRKDVEKEQEDLLVLLDEVTAKRRKDKARLREAGLEVSEDEAEDDDDDEEDE
ncbi:p115 like vesicle tethering protein [Crassisporium funariophilum]|nr:p115 like vesicle tethering protein [Crassisporium funariophilum]